MTDSGGLRALLGAALERRGIVPEDGASSRFLERCETHWACVQRWSALHQLTALREAAEAADRHYLDAVEGLIATQTAAPDSALDVGSGAGWPGLVAAAWWPTVPVTLLDASRKRCSFLRVAAKAMDLDNVRVEQGRIESFKGSFGLVLSRASFSWAEDDFSEGGRALWAQVAPGGRLLAWVGAQPEVKVWDQVVSDRGWTGARVAGSGLRGWVWADRARAGVDEAR